MPGFSLERKAWKNLNRIKTNCGKCNYSLNKWKIIDSPKCNCGANEQTIAHIMCFCPDTFFVDDLLELHKAESDRSIQYLRNLTVNL